MSNIELTKAAKKTIARIYKEYLRRKNEGQPKMQAKYFDNCDLTQQDFISSIREDVSELKNAGLIKRDIMGGIELTDKGIVYMENLTMDTIKEWLSFGSQFIP